MSFLSTAVYTVSTDEDADRLAGMTAGMTAVYAQQPGFERLIVARSVSDPHTIVAMAWWASQEAADAWLRSGNAKAARRESGGEGLKPAIELGRWLPAR